MWRSAGVRREAAELTAAEASIDHWCDYVLGRQFADPAGWQLQNMLSVARLMISAALAREESRGVHLRVDFPRLDNAHWRQHLAFRRPAG
jgi:L-aspartate oxidase